MYLLCRRIPLASTEHSVWRESPFRPQTSGLSMNVIIRHGDSTLSRKRPPILVLHATPLGNTSAGRHLRQSEGTSSIHVVVPTHLELHPKPASWHGPWLACMHSLLHTVQHHRQTTQHLSSLGSTHAHSHARALFPSSQFPDKYGLSSDWQDHGRIESRNTPLPKTISWRQSHSFLLTPSCTTDIQTYINTYIHTYIQSLDSLVGCDKWRRAQEALEPTESPTSISRPGRDVRAT